MQRNYKLGLRTIKTGIAVTLSALISQILQLEYPFYATIACVISMDKTMSIKAGKNRMLGTTLGAFVGVCMVLIDPDNAFLAGFGCIIVVYMCSLLKWKGSVVISCTVISIIMFNLKGRNPYIYSIERLIDTFVGVLVATLVNICIFPINLEEKIMKDFLEINKEIDNFVEGKDIDIKALKNILDEIKMTLKDYDGELHIRHKYVDDIRLIEEHIDAYENILHHLLVFEYTENKQVKDELKKEIENLILEKC